MSRADDPDARIARALRLRGEPPAVARLSRRSLALLAGAGALAIAAVCGWSLADHRRAALPSAAEAEAEAPAPPPPQLGELPKDYAAPARDAPKLGPPLPGDLGRPMLQAGAGPAGPARPADPGRREAMAEAKQARASRLTVATAARGPEPPPPGGAPAAAAPAALVGAHLLRAGTVVPAALVTGLRSDLPGQVVAQVTEDVFDSLTGRWRLIPQGAQLIGTYDDRTGFGQSRVQLVWTRLLLPDGRSIDLGREPAADGAGFAGVADGVDRHWRRLAGAAALSSLLAMGAEAGAGRSGSALADAVRTGAAMAASRAGEQLVGRSLDVRPSLTVRPGFPVRMMLTRDLALEAWPE